MKKVLPIVIVGLVVLGIGGWWFFGGKDAEAPTMPSEIEEEIEEESETFTGKLKQAIAMGVSMKCTYTQGDFTGTSFVKGRNYYGEVSSQGIKSYVVMKDNCMWSWSEEQSQGVKMCYENDIFEEEFEQQGQGQVSIGAEYHCLPSVFSESRFNPPDNINFMDMNQQPGIPNLPNLPELSDIPGISEE